MAIDKVGDSAADLGGSVGFAGGELDAATTEAGNAGAFDRTDIHDPGGMAEYKRDKIESEHQGLRGLVGSAYSGLGLQPSYQSEMDTLSDADNYAHAGYTKFASDSDSQKTRMGLQQLRNQMDAAAADVNKTDYQRQQEAIDSSYKQQAETARSIANNKTFFSQGFKSQAEANAYANNLTHDASVIRDSEVNKLLGARYDEMQSGQERLDVLRQSSAGDKQGAARTQLVNELNAEERRIDPKDTERIKQFDNISTQSLANFDANAGRQGQYQEAQTNDQILAFHEEANEAQLRGEGRTDDARTAALNFSTNQRVKSLQEAADAESDPTRRAQLQREVAAVGDAGKIERDALQQELHRGQMSNTQAAALSGASQLGNSNLAALHQGGPSNLNDAVRKLDATTMKLDKALSHSKTLVLVKD